LVGRDCASTTEGCGWFGIADDGDDGAPVKWPTAPGAFPPFSLLNINWKDRSQEIPMRERKGNKQVGQMANGTHIMF